MEPASDCPPAAIRVLHIVRPASGGIRAHVSALCSEQARRGMHVGIASPQPIPVGDTLCAYHPLPVPAHAAAADLAVWRIAARIARDYDLVHAHGLRGAWIAGPAARRARVPFLFTAHNLAPAPSALVRALFGWALKGHSAAIAVSAAVAASLSAYAIDRVQVIPGGIDADGLRAGADASRARAAFGIPEGAPLVAGAGRLAPEKGFATLIEASPRIAREGGAIVVIAGDGPLRERLDDLARSRGGAARLAGRMDRPGDLLAAADVVAAPSLQEGLGLVPIEAMALGKPVVASDVGGLAEVVEHGVTGLLTPPGDPGALADAVLSLLRDAAMREAMGEAGRRRVLERFTLSRMCDATGALYRAVLARE